MTGNGPVDWCTVVRGHRYVLRDATAEDLDAIAATARRSFWVHRALTDDLERYFAAWEARWQECVASGMPSRLSVIECDGSHIGYAEWSLAADALLISNAAVDRDNRNGGISAGALLLMLSHEARRAELELLRLHTNARMRSNIRLYEQIGFTVVDTFDGQGFAGVVMEMPWKSLEFSEHPVDSLARTDP